LPPVQEQLIDVPGDEPAPAAAAKRATSKGIGAGDIVLLDKKGRRFHALVTELEQLETGRFELAVRPLDSRISYRSASVREVVEVWRKARVA
jgi:hypothetical protein